MLWWNGGKDRIIQPVEKDVDIFRRSTIRTLVIDESAFQNPYFSISLQKTIVPSFL
jgi:hypothetical protein